MRKHSVRFHSMFCEVASKALIAGSSSRNREPALRRRLRPYIVLLDQQRPRNRLQANGLHFTTDQSLKVKRSNAQSYYGGHQVGL